MGCNCGKNRKKRPVKKVTKSPRKDNRPKRAKPNK